MRLGESSAAAPIRDTAAPRDLAAGATEVAAVDAGALRAGVTPRPAAIVRA